MSLSPVALITGGSRGIGSAISARLAKDGFRVVINYANNPLEAQKTVDFIHQSGGTAHAIQADVSQSMAVRELFDHAESLFGGVDVLVNNAGIMKLAPIANSDDLLIEQQLALNLKGPLYAMREAAQRLRNGGRIINMSSSMTRLCFETYGVYAASKAALETLTAIFAKELRGRSITVNAVAPGPTATDLFLVGKSAELVDRLSQANPLERLGTPQDVADVVAFLASEQGGWINGQTLRANGGMA